MKEPVPQDPRPREQVIIVQMPTGVHNERLTNERLSDANAEGWRAHAMRNHNGVLVFLLGLQDGAEQKVVMSPPDEQFEQPINARLAEEHADGWSAVAMENHSGFLVFLMERRCERTYLGAWERLKKEAENATREAQSAGEPDMTEHFTFTPGTTLTNLAPLPCYAPCPTPAIQLGPLRLLTLLCTKPQGHDGKHAYVQEWQQETQQ